MPIETIMTVPVLIRLTTEDNPRGTRVDEFGETVDIYRLRLVEINNPSGVAWTMTIYKDGIVVWSGEIPAGLQQIFTIASGRRFDLHSYSLGLTRVT